MIASLGDRGPGGRRVGHVKRDREDAVTVLSHQVGELLRPAGGSGNQVAGLKCGADQGTAQAARGAGDEPDLLHATQLNTGRGTDRGGGSSSAGAPPRDCGASE